MWLGRVGKDCQICKQSVALGNRIKLLLLMLLLSVFKPITWQEGLMGWCQWWVTSTRIQVVETNFDQGALLYYEVLLKLQRMSDVCIGFIVWQTGVSPLII